MTTIGLIGAGHIGSTVARLAVAAGHDVVLSNSRGPETLADLVAELGDHARAATAAEAAEAGDIVVVTIPLKSYREVPVEPLRGKVVIDTNNYYPQRDGHIAELDDESTTVSELLQAHLPESHVVKALQQHLLRPPARARPPGRQPRTAAPWPSPATTRAPRRRSPSFLDDLGYDAVDAGPLAEGWRYQRDTAAYGTPYTDGWGTADMKPRTGDADRVRGAPRAEAQALPRHVSG